MSIEFKLPDLRRTGLSPVRAVAGRGPHAAALRQEPAVTVGRWLKQPGEPIAAEEKLLEAYSNQFDWDIPSPMAGTLQEIRAAQGTLAHAGEVLAFIAGASAEAAEPVGAASQSAQRASPVALRIAAEHGVGMAQVRGTGAGGRVTKEDVLAFVLALSAPAATPALQAEDTLLELSASQRAMAGAFARQRQAVPHASAFATVDMTNITRRRDALQADWRRREGFALEFMPFIVLAAAAALRAVPVVNALFGPDGIALRRSLHIAPVSSSLQDDDTPVIYHAEAYSLVGMARRLREFTGRAQKPAAAQAAAATFSIVDHGALGGLLATGIVRPGQSAVLSVGAVQPRPVAVDDGLEIHPIAYFGLTYDQRMIDAGTAGRFLDGLKQLLETASFL